MLRAFTPILESLTDERRETSAADIAQLSFEMRVMQARLKAVMSSQRRGKKDENAPTLRKREETETTSTDKTQKGQGKDQTTDDKPPVLKRRD